MCLSISTIFSTELVSSSVEVTRFSTPNMTPSEVAICSRLDLLIGDCDHLTDTDGCRAQLDCFK